MALICFSAHLAEQECKIKCAVVISNNLFCDIIFILVYLNRIRNLNLIPCSQAAKQATVMSYTKLLYHIIFRTKYSRPTLPNDKADNLYRYIWGFVKAHKSILYRVNGIPNHIHLFVELHSTISVAVFVKKLKNSTHNFLDDNKLDFPDFQAWASKYCALTSSEKDKNSIINYIKNQREHHKRESIEEEIRRLLQENNVIINEKYFDEE